MDPRFRRSLKLSLTMHVLVVLALVVGPLVVNWRLRRKRREMVVIDLTLALPDIPSAALAEAATPPKAPDPVRDIPAEPPKPRHQVQKSEKRVTREPPKPNQPKLTPEEIRRLLAAGARISATTSLSSQEFPEAWYYALVQQTMHEAWKQPGGMVPAGVTAEVLVRVERDGRITKRTLTRASGYAVMDDSVMKAVQSVSSLRAFPAQWREAYREISIEFELGRGGSL